MKLPTLFTRAFTSQLDTPVAPVGMEYQSTSTLPITGVTGDVTNLLDLVLAQSTSQTYVSEQAVRGLPAAWRALNLIGHAVGVMMDSAHAYSQGGIVPTPLIVDDPNVTYPEGAYGFFFEVATTLLMHGNYIALKTAYDGDGNATQLIPVHPCTIECRITEAGFPVYKYGEKIYRSDELLHIRGLTIANDFWGVGVIAALRQSMAGSIDMQTYSNDTYRTAAIPSIILQSDETAPKLETLQQLKADWIAAFGSGQRLPVVLPKNMTANPVSWTPEDSQFLEAKQFNIAETAFAFGLDPSDLSATVGGTSQTYANIEQRNIERITSSYGPWIMRIEKSLSRLLPGDLYVRANPEALLRTDTETRFDNYAKGKALGIYSTAYIAAKENITLDGTEQNNNDLGEAA